MTAFLLKTSFFAFGSLWLIMFVVTFYLYTFHKIKLFNNKHKFTLGLVYTALAWPHVLYLILISNPIDDD